MSLKRISLEEELIRGLNRVLSKWKSRDYAPSEWKGINEKRRDWNVTTIESLIDSYGRYRRLTEGQQNLAKDLIEKGNKL